MSGISRRGLIRAGAALGVATQAGAAPARRTAWPKDFLWGTAISAYQSEGNNTNADAWIRENVKPTLFKERSGDACDSYHRYAEDIGAAARLFSEAAWRSHPEYAQVPVERPDWGAADLEPVASA